MNERIKELATTAGISVEYLTNTKQLATLEAFAKSIALDCIDIVAAARDQAIDQEWNLDEAMSQPIFDIAVKYDLDD